MASAIEPAVREQAQRSIEVARLAAIRKHGELQGGMRRWIHHLREECEEAVAEMQALDYHHTHQAYYEHKVRLITELAQVAQLAQQMMTLAYMGKEKEEKEPWEVKEDLNLHNDPAPTVPSRS